MYQLTPRCPRNEMQLERNAQGQPVLLGHGRAAAVCLGRLGGKPVAVKVRALVVV